MCPALTRSKKISPAPVGFWPCSRARITRVSFSTRQSPGSRYAGTLEKTSSRMLPVARSITSMRDWSRPDKVPALSGAPAARNKVHQYSWWVPTGFVGAHMIHTAAMCEARMRWRRRLRTCACGAVGFHAPRRASIYPYATTEEIAHMRSRLLLFPAFLIMASCGGRKPPPPARPLLRRQRPPPSSCIGFSAPGDIKRHCWND